MDVAIQEIQKELDKQVALFESQGKLLEAQRIRQRTNYDIEMMREVGYCTGIENYSRRWPAAPRQHAVDAARLLPEGLLLIIDESHMTLPQVRGMYNGDRARKEVLVDYGFRLPSALDNRPLAFEEFDDHITQAVYVSATPAATSWSMPARTWNRLSGRRVCSTLRWNFGHQGPDRRPGQGDPAAREPWPPRPGDDAH